MRPTYSGATSDWQAAGFELRHLRYFLAAANAGSMSGAKAQVHVSQSSISRAIAQLEEALKLDLFERHTDGVSLTQAGKRFARQAELIVSRFDGTLTRIKNTTRVSRPKIEIGYAPSPTTEIRPLALPALIKAFPEHQIVPCKRSVDECVDQICRGELDCALTVKPLKVGRSSIRFMPLVKYDLHCIVHDNHDFANEPHMPLKRLERESLLVFSATDSPQYMKDLQKLVEPHGVKLNPGLEYEEPSEILDGVAAAYGVALLLESARALSPEKVKWLPLKPAVSAMEVGVIYKHPPSALMPDVLKTIQGATEPLRKGSFASRAGLIA